MNIAEQLPQPHDEHTEMAVLSALMMRNENMAKYGDLLSADIFYYEHERALFRCIDGVINEGHVTDVNSLYSYSQAHDVGYDLNREDFIELVSKFNTMTIEQDIMRLRDMSRRRMTWRMLQEASQSVLDMTGDFEETVSNTLSLLSDVNSAGSADGIISNDEALKGIMKKVEDNRCSKSNGMITGFRLFDEKFLLRPEMLTVIAAFTSVGKSALALNIVQELARQGIPSAYYSLEMSCRELASRLISRDSGLTSSSIMNKTLTDEQVKNLGEAMRKNSNLPIYYDDSSTTDFNRTIRSIRRMAKTKGIRLAVIDYLQIYAQLSEDMEQSISYMARTCKNVAKELGIAVILISQLNRSALHPSLKMLRGSGQIEESADNVVLIDRPEAHNDNKVTKYDGEFKNVDIHGTAKLILAKGRGVGTSSSIVGFDGSQIRFYEMEVKEAGHYQEQESDLPF